jgi:hypothetical protein
VATPVVATMVLFYGVGRWNGYFYVMIFLRDRIKYPISLILREILIANSADTMMGGGDAGAMGDHENIADTIKVRHDHGRNCADPAALSLPAAVFRQGSDDRFGEGVACSDQALTGPLMPRRSRPP